MSAEKRYQVFISSTFQDLVDERQAVLKGVLELDHMPAGMELFPAADDSAWELIKDVIDASDYYVVILGGRYGSLDEEGIGYTEKEYEYAVANNKPIIPLLHKNPDNLPREKTETDETAWEKLQAFRTKIEAAHTCKFWDTSEDLKAKLIVGLTSEVKRHPVVGWVRADQIPTGAALADVLALRERVSELEDELTRVRTEAPDGTEDLMQGEDEFSVGVTFTAQFRGHYDSRRQHSGTLDLSWNTIFAGVAPTLIHEVSEPDLRKAFEDHFSQIAGVAMSELDGLKDKELSFFRFVKNDIDTCLVQLRALGLIRESDKKRSVHDKATYWTLTPYGDRVMVQLRALRRTPSENPPKGRQVEEILEDEVQSS